MFEATAIKPSGLGRPIVCDDCGIDYPADHYKILFDRKKIVYFDFVFPETNYLSCLCHDCFFNNLKKITNGESTKVVIHCDDKKYECEFF